jgi:DNA-binding transcriptional regulator YdaS (Cro superfamily)
MTLQEYFSKQPRGAKTGMARAVGVTKNWISQLLSGEKRPSPALAIAISKYTKGAVTKKNLRPDIFG